MSIECPLCLSPRTRQRHRGKQLGAAIGAIIGALPALAFSPAKVAGLLMPTTGSSVFATAGIARSLAGAAAGAAIGETIDRQFLDTHLCLSCGNTFRTPNTDLPMWDHR